MYEKGDVRVVFAPCDEYQTTGFCDHDRCFEQGSVDDSRASYKQCEVDEVYLPHSCSEWVIGGREQVEALIADLQATLNNTNGRNHETETTWNTRVNDIK